jgi:uncharacterized repeat protein (TIGR01451 family)
VHITGTNFLGATAVTFNGTPAQQFQVTNNNHISAVVPAGVISGPVTVTTPAGTASSAAEFLGPPMITGFNPQHGLPGDAVEINGTNFAGATAVRFGGLDAPFTIEGPGEISAVVPTNAISGPISVQGPGGEAASAVSFVLDYTNDLGVRTTAPDSILLGNTFTYVLVLTNAGPFSAPNVMLTNFLPGSVSFKFGSTTRGSLVTSANPIVGLIGTLAPGATATVTLTVAPQVTASITNVATVAGAYADPVATNNVSTAVTRVYVPPELDVTAGVSNQIRIAWSVALSEFVLQYTDDLSAMTWSNVLAEPQFIGEQKVVSEPIGPGTRFYRLNPDAGE